MSILTILGEKMKKLVILLCLLFLVSYGIAQTPEVAPNFGVGVNAGLIYPIVQDDQGSGTAFGLKVIYSLGGILTVEPNLTFMKYGDPSTSDADLLGLYDGFEGSKLTSYGVDGILGGGGGTGIHPYFLFGVGLYNTKRDMSFQDESDIGYSGGLGLELGMNPAMSLDARGKLIVIPADGGGSKKSASATVGINYYFGK